MNVIKKIFLFILYFLCALSFNAKAVDDQVQLGIFNTGGNTTYEIRARPYSNYSSKVVPTGYVTIKVPSPTTISNITTQGSGLSGWSINPNYVVSSGAFTTYLIETTSGGTTNASWTAGAEVLLFTITLSSAATGTISLATDTDPTVLQYMSDNSVSPVDGYYGSDILTGLVESQVNSYYSLDATLRITLLSFDVTHENITTNIIQNTKEKPDINRFETTASYVYPNPVKDLLKIKGTVVGKIQLINNAGKVVYSADNIPTEGIDMASLSAGVYLVRVTHKDGSSTIRKIVKQ